MCSTNIAWYAVPVGISTSKVPPASCHELHSKCQQLRYKEVRSSKILNKDIQILNLKVLLNSDPLVCNFLR